MNDLIPRVCCHILDKIGGKWDVGVTHKWAGVDFAWEQEKFEARKNA